MPSDRRHGPVELAQRKALHMPKVAVECGAESTIWRLSLMPCAPPLVNSPVVLRKMTAGGLDC